MVTHFAKRTELRNYLRETHKKVVQIHRRLPAGTILVFLTGKREILYMCQKLTRSLNRRRASAAAAAKTAAGSSVIATETAREEDQGGQEEGPGQGHGDYFSGEGDEDGLFDDSSQGPEQFEDQDGIESDNSEEQEQEMEDEEDTEQEASDQKDMQTLPKPESEDFAALRNRMLQEALGDTVLNRQEEKETDELAAHPDPAAPHPEPEPESLKALVLPLYAMMPTDKQRKVFEPPPPGFRLIIVATNVAVNSSLCPCDPSVHLLSSMSRRLP